MSASAQPDYIFILCDQLRADFLRAYGCDAIDTPNLDWLASQSVIYDHGVSTCPLCVPARAAMLTGMTPLQSGVISNEHWLRPDRAQMGYRTWPELMTEAGYHTAAVGKMHFRPFESPEGFAERIIAEDKRWPLIQDGYAAFLRKKGLWARISSTPSNRRTTSLKKVRCTSRTASPSPPIILSPRKPPA